MTQAGAGRRAALQVGAHFREQCEVIGGLEAVGEQQHGDVGLLEDVLQFVGAVGGVDVDQHGARVGGGELDHDPLRPVGGPDADVLAAADAERHQGAGRLPDLGVKRGVAAAVVQPGEHQGVAGAVALGGLGQHLGEGQSIDPGPLCVGHGGSS